MSQPDDRTPSGPQMGDRALQRALAAAAVAGVPEPVVDREKTHQMGLAALKARKREFAHRCTEQLKDILGHDIKLKPGNLDR